jgi:WD40 repeat protein
MPEPYTLVLEFLRADKAGDPYTFRMEPQVYNRRVADKTYKDAELSWDVAFVADIEALRASKRDAEVIGQLSKALRAFLEKIGWSREEAALIEAIDQKRPVVVTIRSAAAELYTLPWELLALGQTMQHIGELPNVTVRYEWPGTKTTPEKPSTRLEGGRIFLAYSHAGGRVRANDHIAAIQDACDDAGHTFDMDTDVLPGASRRSLGETLAEARKENKPISVLQILCHGGPIGSTFGLMLDADDEGGVRGVDPGRFASLLAEYADMIRLVVVISCDSGNTGRLGNQMGSVAQAIHRAGVAAVVASRYPFSVKGASEFVRVFYHELLVPPRSVEEAFVAARQHLSAFSTRLDWASVQLYARDDDGFDTRPVVMAPYRGLLPFERRHERFFFGREGKDRQGKDREVDELVRELGSLVDAHGSARFMVVAGDSGTGKSSMVLAGAVPRLETKGWIWGSMRPGSLPMAALDEALAALDAQLRNKRDAGEHARSLLIVDQFEEVFTSVAKAEDRTAFVRRLWERASLSDDAYPSVIVTIRIDFLGRCGEILLEKESGLRLDKVAAAHQVQVAQMDGDQLRDAIEEPARKVGLTLEPGLTKRIMDGVDEEPGALPLMQHTLRLLWARREGRMLTQASYDDFGGVAGALNQHADGVLMSFNEEKQRLARRLVVRLVNLGDGDAVNTRRRMSLSELRPRVSADAARFDEVLKELVDQRLLVRSGQRDEQTVEIAHEALIRKWETLRGWLEGERSKLLNLENQRKLRRLGVITALAMAAAAVTGVTAKWALGQRDEAQQAQREATVQRDAARTASRMAGARELLARGQGGLGSRMIFDVRDPEKVRGWRDLATDLLVHGIPKSTLSHKGKVRSAAWSPDGKRLVTASEDKTARVWNADGSGDPIVLSGHAGSVNSAAWSPDGKRIVTASWDRTARIWNADGTSDPIILKGHEGEVISAVWSPDGKRIVTASWDRTARIWNADGTSDPIVLKGHDGEVTAAVWSSDGKRVVTASADRTAQIWNADGTGATIVLKGHESNVYSAAWSPDGKRIVTASWDNTARIWNADGTGAPIVLKGHEGAINSAAWSPDGKRVVTASQDNNARIWNADGTGAPIVLKGHDGWVFSAAWSPDGERISTASWDKTARVWNADGTGTTIIFKDHEGVVRSAAWSPDGKRIVTASEDNTARTWNADGSDGPLMLRGHDRYVYSAGWSPNGERIVTASADKTARIWNADGTGAPLVLKGHENTVRLAAWSPDGERIVTASEDKTARIWNADGTGTPLVLKGHEAQVWSAAWSPDGKRVVTASWDWTARIWNADGTGTPLVLRGHDGEVRSVAWSPDGKRIVTASWDKTARIWSADGTGTFIVLKGHEREVLSAAWSPDGKRIVTASGDTTVRVWNADNMGDPLILRGHTEYVTSAAWSPDGKRIVTASGDTTVRVWNADGTSKSIIVGSHTDKVTSAAWSPDGKRIVTASEDNTARVWFPTIPALQQALRGANNDCLTLEQRETYLTESESDARPAYEACERSYGRTPFFGAAKP